MKTDKKGFLLAEETLKIILAVIAIGFLAYLLFSLYNANKTAKDLELAEESLDFLVQEINAQRAEVAEVEIYNPKGWIILSWPYENENELPNSCKNLAWDNCICIVDDLSAVDVGISKIPFTASAREKILKKSDKKGICVENIKDLIVKKDGNQQQSIKIKDPPITLLIDYQNKLISEI